MKLLRLTALLCLAVIHLHTPPSFAGDWKFPMYISFISGIYDVSDAYTDTMNAESTYAYYVDDGFVWPVGFGFHPFYEFDAGFRLGAGIGPYSMIIGDEEDYFCLPTFLFTGFTFFPDASVSPYIKVGMAYPMASGGYVESKSPGLFGAVGFEFMRKRRVNLGFECAVDTSEIEITSYDSGQKGTMDVNPVDIIVSFIVVF